MKTLPQYDKAKQELQLAEDRINPRITEIRAQMISLEKEIVKLRKTTIKEHEAFEKAQENQRNIITPWIYKINNESVPGLTRYFYKDNFDLYYDNVAWLRVCKLDDNWQWSLQSRCLPYPELILSDGVEWPYELKDKTQAVIKKANEELRAKNKHWIFWEDVFQLDEFKPPHNYHTFKGL